MYRFSNLVDVPKLQALHDAIYKNSGFASAILDPDGTVLVASGWKVICSEFHRKHPETLARCKQSDIYLASRIKKSGEYTSYKCLNGLVDVAKPIRIEGEHVATLFTGQFLFEEPDFDFFRAQAKQFGFDETAYLDALAKVPVITKDQLDAYMNLLINQANLLIDIGLKGYRYRELVENANSIILRWKPDGTITFFNDFAQAFFGYSESEIIGKNLFDTIVPATDTTGRNLKKMIQGIIDLSEEYKNNENENRCKDGKKVWISWTNKPLLNENGHINEILSIGNDITKRKQTETALLESEKRYRLLVENQNDLIVKFDANQKLLYASPSYCQIFGMKEKDLLGESFFPLIHKDDVEIVKASIRSLKESPHKTYHEERVETIDGWRWFGWSLRANVDKKGNIFETIAIGRDITERKQVEKKLKRSEALLNTTQQLAKVGGWEIDLEKNFTSWTDGVYRIHDLQPEEFTAIDEAVKRSLECYDSEDRPVVMDAFKKCTEKGEPYDLVFPFTTNKGIKKWIRTIANPVMEGDRVSKAVGFFMDITEQKKLEDNLRQAQKMEAVGTLAGGIAHDFNNILGGIVGYTELAQDDTSQNSPVQEYLGEILKSATRAKDLVRQILAFSRKSQEEKKPILIHPIIKEVAKLLRSTTPTTIEIIQKIDESSGMANADPTQIHQIVMNLCTNAVHAIEEHGGVLEISLSSIVLTEKNMGKFHELTIGPYLELKISDTGSGIEPSILPRIFEPFFTTKEKEKGTGMGLSVVHGIVKNYGGDIIAESQTGQGSTFTVVLPQIQAESKTTKKPPASIPKGDECILFIDDEKTLVDIGKKLLQSLGYTVITCSGSFEALEKFEHQPDKFDLVITDQTMPHMTGFDLAKRLLKINPSINVILCTGYSEIVTQEKAESEGIKTLIYKPIRKKEIAGIIREVLDKHNHQ